MAATATGFGERIAWIDCLRFVSFCAVALQHVS